MPVIQVDMWRGRDENQKAALVAALTREMSRTCGCRDEDVTIIIRESERSDWADGGHLASSADYALG